MRFFLCEDVSRCNASLLRTLRFRSSPCSSRSRRSVSLISWSSRSISDCAPFSMLDSILSTSSLHHLCSNRYNVHLGRMSARRGRRSDTNVRCLLPSEPCFFITATCSFRLESRSRPLLGHCLVSWKTSSQVSVVLYSYYNTLCCVFLDFARFALFLETSQACRFSTTCPKSTCSNWMTSGASLADRLLCAGFFLPSFGLICNPSGRWDEVLVHESEDAITILLEFSFHFRDVFSRIRRVLLVALLSLLCAICSF